MLTAASDYKFVDTSNISGMINGNIMPVVSPQTSAVAPVYFEDYLFLLEGFYERMNLDQAGANNISPPPPTIYQSNIIATEIPWTTNYMWTNYINRNFQGDQPIFISPDAVVIQNQITSIDTGSPWRYDNSPAILSAKNEPITHGQHPIYSFPFRPHTWWWPLWGEYIRARYWELERCCKVLTFDRLGMYCSQTVEDYYDKDGNITSQDSISLQADKVYDISHGYTTEAGGRRWYISHEYISTYRQSIMLPYAKSATLLVSVRVSSQANRVIVPYQLNVQFGNIIIPNGIFKSLAQQGCQFLGYDFNQIGVTVHYPSLVIDFEFPARLNGVNWNWQPLSS